MQDVATVQRKFSWTATWVEIAELSPPLHHNAVLSLQGVQTAFLNLYETAKKQKISQMWVIFTTTNSSKVRKQKRNNSESTYQRRMNWFHSNENWSENTHIHEPQVCTLLLKNTQSHICMFLTPTSRGIKHTHTHTHIQLLQVNGHRGRKWRRSADCFLWVPRLILKVCITNLSVCHCGDSGLASWRRPTGRISCPVMTSGHLWPFFH